MIKQKNINQILGLSSVQAKELQEKFGKNELIPEKKENFFHKIIEILSEPMFLLLIIAAAVYFVLGEPKDGIVMLVSVLGVISIDIIQEWRTDKTLKALKDLSAPQIKVIRDDEEMIINSKDLVPGDLMLIYEGIKIPADGYIVSCSDLRVDESSLTGEAEGVWKIIKQENNPDNDYWKKDYCYAGTLVTQGSGSVSVEKIGTQTEYGKIGINIAEAPEILTPLQKQIRKLVKFCALIAATLSFFVGFVTYLNLSDYNFKNRIIESILSGITLAMALIPEEFPVILTVFLSIGAWRLAKKQSLVRKLASVETLGAVSVLCVDKTGTITMNQMVVEDLWSIKNDTNHLCEIMGMACETDTYDSMEKAMLFHCETIGISSDYLFSGNLITEYSFTNETKMMGHVWQRDNNIIVAAKGSPEYILALCNLSVDDYESAEKEIIQMSKEGLRVIAVAEARINKINDIPKSLSECDLQLCGMVGLADPPRDSIKNDIKNCISAGVRIVMITGDNGITASSIAKQIGMQNSDKIITGEQLDQMSEYELKLNINNFSIFSRVIPEHKMKIVKAFKDNGEVVAMMGDGVNDASALKYSDIGIAMGKRGSEVSREAADLILLDDNFSTIVDTIKDGRRIYDNIKKAVGYIFTIHIPTALASLFAPLLDISPAWIMLLPLHIVLLELIIDPTCSIVLERQPAEKDIMNRPARNPNEKLISFKSLTKSILQGLVIFIASFGTYLFFFKMNHQSAEIARTMGLSIIMLSNIFLVHVNSSETDFAFRSFMKMIKDKVIWAVSIGTIIGLAIMLYSPLNTFLKLSPLSINQVLLVVLTSFISVTWYEIVKLVKYLKNKI